MVPAIRWVRGVDCDHLQGTTRGNDQAEVGNRGDQVPQTNYAETLDLRRDGQHEHEQDHDDHRSDEVGGDRGRRRQAPRATVDDRAGLAVEPIARRARRRSGSGPILRAGISVGRVFRRAPRPPTLRRGESGRQGEPGGAQAVVADRNVRMVAPRTGPNRLSGTVGGLRDTPTVQKRPSHLNAPAPTRTGDLQVRSLTTRTAAR
jgi:hypothetical protein